MFPALGSDKTARKKLDLIENTFPLALKQTGSAPDIYWKLHVPYQHVLHYQHTLIRSNKATCN